MFLLYPYNPIWKAEFDALQLFLNTELGDFEIDIQHVGSTAIPEIYAKPILDVDIILKNKKQLDNLSVKLERLGYKNKGEQGITGRYAFRQTSALTPTTDQLKKWQEHHLYVCFSDSLALKNHLVFRDVLLQDKALAHSYSQLKINLMNEKGITRDKYNKLKTDFILSVLTNNGLSENEIDEIKKANK